MSNNLQEPLPIEVSHFGNFEARMLRNFQAAVEDWDEVCSALGAWEAQHLTRDDAGQAVQQHRRWVTELVVLGPVGAAGDATARIPGQDAGLAGGRPRAPLGGQVGALAWRCRLRNKTASCKRPLSEPGAERLLAALQRETTASPALAHLARRSCGIAANGHCG